MSSGARMDTMMIGGLKSAVTWWSPWNEKEFSSWRYSSCAQGNDYQQVPELEISLSGSNQAPRGIDGSFLLEADPPQVNHVM